MSAPVAGPLIVNADDFGQTKGICEGILEAHERGILTSTTLMANGAAFEFAVSSAKSRPSLGVGVHLNFVEGQPVAPPTEVASLIDRNGRLVPKFSLIRRYCTGKLDLDELDRETAAQIDKVIHAGVTPTHVDAHKNIHAFPAFFRVVTKVAASRGIRAVRLPCESHWHRGASLHPSGLTRTLLLNTASHCCRGVLKQTPLATTDRFAGTMQTGRINAEWLLRWIDQLHGGSVELMVHPGKCDPELLAADTRLKDERQVELAALTDRRVIERVRDRGIQLIHFGQLAS